MTRSLIEIDPLVSALAVVVAGTTTIRTGRSKFCDLMLKVVTWEATSTNLARASLVSSVEKLADSSESDVKVLAVMKFDWTQFVRIWVV